MIQQQEVSLENIREYAFVNNNITSAIYIIRGYYIGGFTITIGEE